MINKIIKEIVIMSNLQPKVLSAFAWFFGVVFIIAAWGMFSTGNSIVGLLFLIGGCLLLPPVKQLILDKKPSLSKGKITAVASILIFISSFFLQSNEDTEQMSVLDNQAQSDTTGDESTSLALDVDEQVVEDEVVAIEDEVVATEDNSYDDSDDYEEYEDSAPVESKRSKLPNPFIDFNVSVKEVDNTPILSFISRNKKPLHIYDVIVNDGISCNIYGDKSERTGVVNFGENFDLFVYDCRYNQIVEVKVITDKGYNVFTF